MSLVYWAEFETLVSSEEDLLEQTEKNLSASETQSLFIEGREILMKTHDSWKWEMKREQEHWAMAAYFPVLTLDGFLAALNEMWAFITERFSRNAPPAALGRSQTLTAASVFPSHSLEEREKSMRSFTATDPLLLLSLRRAGRWVGVKIWHARTSARRIYTHNYLLHTIIYTPSRLPLNCGREKKNVFYALPNTISVTSPYNFGRFLFIFLTVLDFSPAFIWSFWALNLVILSCSPRKNETTRAGV